MALGTFDELPSVLNKGKSAIRSLFNGPKVLPSASEKAKAFAENFSTNFNLDDSGIDSGTFLPVFPSQTNLKLHNISVTPKMFDNVIKKLNLSNVSGPDCISVVALKNL